MWEVSMLRQIGGIASSCITRIELLYIATAKCSWRRRTSLLSRVLLSALWYYFHLLTNLTEPLQIIEEVSSIGALVTNSGIC